MHTKLNTRQTEPNFLTYVIWPKTTPRTIMNLELYIFKIKHISRINISGNCKIGINSPEVGFGIKR
jgi:hypothetical protein